MQDASLSSSQDIESIYKYISSILIAARSSAWQAINAAMVAAYWEVGKAIIEEEQKGKKKARYGESLISNLSDRLSRDIGKGFSASNLGICAPSTLLTQFSSRCLENCHGHIYASSCALKGQKYDRSMKRKQ